jgi:DNA-binding transcriptional ArsR family regulator
MTTATTMINAAALQRVGRALSDGTRAAILITLAGGAAYPTELAAALGVSRSSPSNHLKCLRGCGLVRTIPEGRSVRYELIDDRLGLLMGVLSDVAVADHCDTCDGRSRSGR